MLFFIVCRLLEDEKMAGLELKQTWKLANDGFLERQKSLQNEIDCMKILLSPQQQEILKDMLHKKSLTDIFPSDQTVSSSTYVSTVCTVTTFNIAH